jgi:hypothetical protein
MKKAIYIVILFFALVWRGSEAFAQPDSVTKAVLIMQDQTSPPEVKVKKALEVIDRAILNPQSAQDAYAWYIRGFIYKDWYKTFEPQNKKSKTRLSSVEYFKKSLELDTKNEYSAETKKTLKYLGSTFYNDAGELLNSSDYTQAQENYEHFKECMLLAEPNYNLKPREMEFKKALATVYERIFRQDIKGNVKFFSMTEELYKQVLALDTNDWAGNYNLAMLYYNYGVDMINNMKVDEDIIIVENIQDEARGFFKKALPYALRAFAMNPKRREVLVALQGIYFSLYEFEKSDEFKAKVEAIDKEK